MMHLEFPPEFVHVAFSLDISGKSPSLFNETNEDQDQ
jgi:hypothetical protein